MDNNKETELGNKTWIVVIGLIASVIGIITFLSGKQSVREFVATDVPSGVSVITVVVPQPAAESSNNNQPIVIVVTQEPQSSNNSIPSNSSGAQSPAQFVQDYYSFISSGNYEKSWSMLSQHFKDTYNASGYQPYADWWSKVQAIEVLSVNVENQDSYSANMSVELKYYYQNGQIDTYDLMSFTLVFASGINDWLINDAYLVKGTR